VNSRKQAIIVAVAGTLLLAALITAVVWVAVLEQGRRQQIPAAGVSPAPTSELRIYGGLPNADHYGHSIVVLTNIGYLSGYCEARRNPAWVGFSISSITGGSLGKRPSKFFTDTRTQSATHQDYTGSGYDRGRLAPSSAIGTRYGQEAQRETFLMSNISPQSKELNQMWWHVWRRTRPMTSRFDWSACGC
jgi:endonuclease G